MRTTTGLAVAAAAALLGASALAGGPAVMAEPKARQETAKKATAPPTLTLEVHQTDTEAWLKVFPEQMPAIFGLGQAKLENGTWGVPVTYSAPGTIRPQTNTYRVTITADDTPTPPPPPPTTGRLAWECRDAAGAPLGGSSFVLTPGLGGLGSLTVLDNGPADRNPAAGQVQVDGLAFGGYTVIQASAPAGYSIDPVALRIAVVDKAGLTAIGTMGVDDPSGSATSDFHCVGSNPPPPPPPPTVGLHVLIVEEKSDRGKLPKGQVDILSATAPGSVRDYLRNNCPKGSDNLTPEFRIVDKDAPFGLEDKDWQEARRKFDEMGLPVPGWIVTNGSNYAAGKLPDTPEEALRVLAGLNPKGGR